jgi:hypothetical protein
MREFPPLYRITVELLASGSDDQGYPVEAPDWNLLFRHRQETTQLQSAIAILQAIHFGYQSPQRKAVEGDI